MPEIRALVVDDEPLARRGVRQLLSEHAGFVVVGECRDGPEAVKALARIRPDVVFLDVQMPGMNGLQVTRLFGVDRMPLVVFVTAHDQFAVRAFEAAAVDYLVKPISAARFGAAIRRVRERLQARDAMAASRRLQQLEQLMNAQGLGAAEGELITVNDGPVMRVLQPNEVDWIAADDYCALVHSGENTYRIRESLDSLEGRLRPEAFARVHRSSIVRLDRVRELRTDPGTSDAQVVLRDGTVLAVSRRRLARLRRRLAQRGEA